MAPSGWGAKPTEPPTAERVDDITTTVHAASPAVLR